jgi:hypothetical protein
VDGGTPIEAEYARFAEIKAEWQATATVSEDLITGWTGHLQAMRAEEGQLRHHGLWVAGPTDL